MESMYPVVPLPVNPQADPKANQADTVITIPQYPEVLSWFVLFAFYFENMFLLPYVSFPDASGFQAECPHTAGLQSVH